VRRRRCKRATLPLPLPLPLPLTLIQPGEEEALQKGVPGILSTRNGAGFQPVPTQGGSSGAASAASDGGAGAGDAGEGRRGAASCLDEGGRSQSVGALSAPSSQCGSAPVRQCGTPGCELAAYHEGPCQSQQVVGRTRLDPSA
jgi:hypothetical protein